MLLCALIGAVPELAWSTTLGDAGAEATLQWSCGASPATTRQPLQIPQSYSALRVAEDSILAALKHFTDSALLMPVRWMPKCPQHE
jgi:hypothetical protein